MAPRGSGSRCPRGTELSSSSGLSPQCVSSLCLLLIPAWTTWSTNPVLNKAFGSLSSPFPPLGLGGRSSSTKTLQCRPGSAPWACPKEEGGAGVRCLLGTHPKCLGWADTGSAPSPFHSRAKCLRVRWNFTPELGRIQGSGYRLPYSLMVLVLRASTAPQGSLQHPLCSRGLGGGGHPGQTGCEAAPTPEEQENPKNHTHYFN